MTPATFLARLREPHGADPNLSDVTHLLELVRSGDVIARPDVGHAPDAAMQSALAAIPDDEWFRPLHRQRVQR